MPKYRIAKTGHFMGKYYNAGDEVDLYERQAKYALMSGQIEAVEEMHAYHQRYGKKGRVYGKPQEVKETKVAPDVEVVNAPRRPAAPQEADTFGRENFRATPKGEPIPHAESGRKRSSSNERFSRRSVGGTAGGEVKE